MKLISWNVNGLRAVINKNNFLEYLQEENPDIIGLQETKLQQEQIPEQVLSVDGYFDYWNFAQRKGYSGVALFTKEKPLQVSYDLGRGDFDSEGRVIIAEYEKFVLINCYFPNGQKDDDRLQFKLDFYEMMLAKMNEIVDSGKNLLVCGDYNTAHREIDLKNPQANANRSGFLPIEREWMDKLVDSGYVDTFRHFYPDKVQYSWWSYRFNARQNNAGWRIDYFFANGKFMPNVADSFIRTDVLGSDHCPVGIELQFQFAKWKVHTKSIHPSLKICNWRIYDKMEKLLRTFT